MCNWPLFASKWATAQAWKMLENRSDNWMLIKNGSDNRCLDQAVGRMADRVALEDRQVALEDHLRKTDGRNVDSEE